MNRYILTIPTLVLTSGFFSVPKVFADEVSVGIYPPVIDVITSPGAVTTHEFIVKNNRNESVTLTPLFQPFKASNDRNGVVSYQSHTPPFFKNLAVLVDGSLTDTIELGPEEEKQISLRIATPETESSTDYYFSLIMMSVPKQKAVASDTSGITAISTLSGGVASHVLVSINPPPASEITLNTFSTPFFSQSTPHIFHVAVSNKGSHYSRIYGELTIKDIFGNSVKKLIIPETRILSQSTRALTTTGTDTSQERSLAPEIQVKENLFPGVYRAELVLVGDSMSNPISKSIYFNVTPMVIVLTLVILLLVGLLIKSRLKNQKS